MAGREGPEEEEKEADGAEDNGQLVLFETKFFAANEGAFFRLDGESNEPVFALNYGGMDALLPLRNIKREFELDADSHDAQMLDKVVEGLQFVKVIPVGGPLPEEVLSGKASWEVSERHQILARHRVTMRLVGWMTGREDVITDAAELIRMANDPAVKDKVNDAFDSAAEAMGLGGGRKDEVVDLIHAFSQLQGRSKNPTTERIW